MAHEWSSELRRSIFVTSVSRSRFLFLIVWIRILIRNADQTWIRIHNTDNRLVFLFFFNISLRRRRRRRNDVWWLWFRPWSRTPATTASPVSATFSPPRHATATTPPPPRATTATCPPLHPTTHPAAEIATTTNSLGSVAVLHNLSLLIGVNTDQCCGSGSA